MASTGEGAGSPTQSPQRRSARQYVESQRRKQRAARRLIPAMSEDDPDSPARDVSPEPTARMTADPPQSPDTKTLLKALARVLVAKEDQPAPPRDDIRLQVYDGKVEFADYMVQFQAAAELGGWTDEVKRHQLLGHLSGTALSVGANLHNPTFQQLVDHLMAHFGPRRSGASALTLSTREQAKGETLSDFSHSILRLTRQAYPHLDSEVQDQIARTHFTVGCSDANVRQRLREDQPPTLAAALEKARTITEGREAELHRARVRRTWEEPETVQRQPAAPAAEPPAAQPTAAAAPEGPSRLQDTLDQLVRVLQVQSGAAAPSSQPSEQPAAQQEWAATVRQQSAPQTVPQQTWGPAAPEEWAAPVQQQPASQMAPQQPWGPAPQQPWVAPAPQQPASPMVPQQPWGPAQQQPWAAPAPGQPAPAQVPQQQWGPGPQQQWAAPAPPQPTSQQQTRMPPAQPQTAGQGDGIQTAHQNQGNGSGRQ